MHNSHCPCILHALAISNTSIHLIKAYISYQISYTKYSHNIINDDGENHNKTRKFYGPVDIQKIHVRLIDQYGRLVDLNNMDFTFSLELTQLYNNI